MRIQKNTSKKPIKFLIIAAIALALIGGAVAYAYTQHVWPFASSESTPNNQSTSSTNDIDYSGPSDEDVASSQDAKKDAETKNNSSNSSSSSTNSKKDATVGISYADVRNGKLEVRAFVTNVIEGGGKCTATAVMEGMPSMKKTSTVEASIDASSTQCDPIFIPSSDLHSGVWNVTVTYSSSSYQGTSDTVQVNVP